MFKRQFQPANIQTTAKLPLSHALWPLSTKQWLKLVPRLAAGGLARAERGESKGFFRHRQLNLQYPGLTPKKPRFVSARYLQGDGRQSHTVYDAEPQPMAKMCHKLRPSQLQTQKAPESSPTCAFSKGPETDLAEHQMCGAKAHALTFLVLAYVF